MKQEFWPEKLLEIVCIKKQSSRFILFLLMYWFIMNSIGFSLNLKFDVYIQHSDLTVYGEGLK